MNAIRWISFILLALCLVLEGLWLAFALAIIGAPPNRFLFLLAAWALVVVATIFHVKWPAGLPLTAWINFGVCGFIIKGGGNTGFASFLHRHIFDLLIIFFAHIVAYTTAKTIYGTTRTSIQS